MWVAVMVAAWVALKVTTLIRVTYTDKGYYIYHGRRFAYKG